MNTWIIAAVICLAVIAGIFFVSALNSSAVTADTSKCTSCGGKCTAGNSCGLQSCGAATGGKCTCGNK